jgi:chromosome segregation ATPase
MAATAAPNCPKVIKEEAKAAYNTAIGNVIKERGELATLMRKNRGEEGTARGELNKARAEAFKALFGLFKAGADGKKASQLAAKIDRLEDRLEFLKLREGQNTVDVTAAQKEVDALTGGSPANITEAKKDLKEEQRELARTKDAITATSKELAATQAALDKLCK